MGADVSSRRYLLDLELRVTHGLLLDIVEHVRGDIDSRTLDLVGPASIIPDAGSNGANISLCQGDGLAIVERLNGGEEFEVLLDELGQLEHVSTALSRGHLLPRALKGLARSGDSNVDILFVGLVYGADHLLGRGVDDLKGLLVDALYKFIIDEAVRRRSSQQSSGRNWGVTSVARGKVLTGRSAAGMRR
jgi:hypothetical protein